MMGQQPSSRAATNSLSRNNSLREVMQKKFSRSKQNNYSATFNVPESDVNWDLLNINTVTEEELMTLPGINRTVAHNIVEYRQDIGGFKKIEDLALVSGVGASKLELFRNEITVNPRKRLNNNNSFINFAASRCSSQNQSLESLPTSDSSSKLSIRHGSVKVINVNTANVFQLMAVRGINQELAANIVDYRDRKRRITSIGDLLKVKGMTAAKLSAIKINLCVEKGHNEENQSNKLNGIGHSIGRITPKQGRTRSNASNKSACKDATNDTLLHEVYSLLLRENKRPIIEDPFCNVRNERNAFRLATWNLESFSQEKSRNPGIQDVICHTLLENGLSLVVVQELLSPETLNSIVSELNEPLLPSIKSWTNNRGIWFASAPVPNQGSEQSQLLSGFLYETTHGLHLRDVYVMDLPNTSSPLSAKPLIGLFRLYDLDFLLVSLYIQDNDANSQFQQVTSYLKEKFQDETNVIIVEVQGQGSCKKELKPVICNGYSEVLPINTVTHFSEKIQCSRIWISENFKTFFTGFHGVVREGLHHLAIPNGWTWGGSVSQFCPVWMELYTSASNMQNGHDVMNGNATGLRN